MDAPVKLMTRSALVDFMEGAVGIIIDWPTEVPEGYHIEVILPKLAGRVEGRPDNNDNLRDIELTIARPSNKHEVRKAFEQMLSTGEPITTLHTNGGVRIMHWTFKKAGVAAA